MDLLEKVVDVDDFQSIISQLNLPTVEDIFQKIKTDPEKTGLLDPLESYIFARSFLRTFLFEKDFGSDEQSYLPKEKLLYFVGIFRLFCFLMNLRCSSNVKLENDPDGSVNYIITDLDDNNHYVIIGHVLAWERMFDYLSNVLSDLALRASEDFDKKLVEEFVYKMDSLEKITRSVFPEVNLEYFSYSNYTIRLDDIKAFFEIKGKFSYLSILLKHKIKYLAINFIHSLIANYNFVRENERKPSNDKVDIESDIAGFFIFSNDDRISKYTEYLRRILTFCVYAGIKFEKEFLDDHFSASEILPNGYKYKNDVEKFITELRTNSSSRVN